MTKKLFNCILTIWLLISSLYLPAFADTTNATKASPAKSVIKKSADAQFLEGVTCLSASNIPCAKMSLALIPSISPYAKILEGALAFQENQTDRALLLLLPIQAHDSLTLPAKMQLHQTLAQAFTSLGDVQQAIHHFILAEASLSKIQAADTANKTLENHQNIWDLLKPLNQAELVTLRGNNTDTVFQGWIDLALAANKPASNSIANWNMLYADHPALGFADSLSKNSTSAAQAQTDLALSGTIALILPTAAEVDVEKLSAFKLGLETALNLAAMPNTIEVYYRQQSAQEASAAYTQAMDAGSDYLIVPDFNVSDANSHYEQIANKQVLHLGLSLNDDAKAVLKFARKNAMQHITVVTTQHETSQQMLASIQQAWPQNNDGTINTIVLTANVLAQPGKLLDLKSQIAANIHDMVILAMPASDVVKIRPYLDISTPTMAFSSIHNIAYENDSLKLLNALRFVDMPFLLESNQVISDYQSVAAGLNNKTLLRWFALGADSLQLLISSNEKPNNVSLISGLGGDYSISETGGIDRSLITARFNQTGAIPD